MKQYNVILTGTAGAGKATAVQSVSDSGMASSEMLSGLPVSYGVVALSPTEQVRLYGITGEGNFGPVGDVLDQSACAVVILLDNRRNNPFRDLKRHLSGFAHLLESRRVAVGITHSDHPRAEPLERSRQWMQRDDLLVQMEMVSVDARNKADILALLLQALASARQPSKAAALPQPPVVVDPPPDKDAVGQVMATPDSHPDSADAPPPNKKLLKKLWNMVYLE